MKISQAYCDLINSFSQKQLSLWVGSMSTGDATDPLEAQKLNVFDGTFKLADGLHKNTKKQIREVCIAKYSKNGKLVIYKTIRLVIAAMNLDYACVDSPKGVEKDNTEYCRLVNSLSSRQIYLWLECWYTGQVSLPLDQKGWLDGRIPNLHNGVFLVDDKLSKKTRTAIREACIKKFGDKKTKKITDIVANGLLADLNAERC